MLGGWICRSRRVSGLCPGEGSARGEGDSSVAPTDFVAFPGALGGRFLRMTGVFRRFVQTRSDKTCHSEGGAARYFPFARQHGADRRIFVGNGRIFPSRCVSGLCPEEGSARGEGDSSVAPTGFVAFPGALGGRFLRMTGAILDQYEAALPAKRKRRPRFLGRRTHALTHFRTHALPLIRSCSQLTISSCDRRVCSMVSRSRMVTVPCSIVSPSMVMQNGVPASSCRRYRRPMAPASS